MPPIPLGSTVWILTFESYNYHLDPAHGNVGAYTSEEAAKQEAYRLLKDTTRNVLRLHPDAPIPINIDGDSRGSRVSKWRSAKIVEVIVKWARHCMR